MILKAAKNLAQTYFDEPETDLHQELAKLASEHDLNAQTIERIVNRANRNIIVGLQKQAVKGDIDPHFVFPKIKTANVLAVLKAKKPLARATRPSSKPSIDGVFPDCGCAPPSRASELSMQGYMDGKPPNKAIAMAVLQMLKHKASEAKSRAAKVEIALESMISEFSKRASHELLSGTPVEVLQKLPVQDLVDPVVEETEGLGKLAHISEDFELDLEHPLVKLANEIVKTRVELKQAQSDLSEALDKVDQARKEVNEHSV